MALQVMPVTAKETRKETERVSLSPSDCGCTEEVRIAGTQYSAWHTGAAPSGPCKLDTKEEDAGKKWGDAQGLVSEQSFTCKLTARPFTLDCLMLDLQTALPFP